MGSSTWRSIKKANLRPEQIERVNARVKSDLLDMDLRDLRAVAGLTQVDVANQADMTQAELSRIERRDDHLVSTLRRYVEALGGELEVVAVLGNKRITLRGV